MNPAAVSPFDSIESAHEFVCLFSQAVAEARMDVDADIQRASGSPSARRLDAFRLAAYHLEKLEQHLNKSRRILNDLRSLRRLLFEERAGGRAVARLAESPPPPVEVPQIEVVPPPVPALAVGPVTAGLPTAPRPPVAA